MINVLCVTKSWTIMRTLQQHPARLGTATFWTLLVKIVSFRNFSLPFMRLTDDFHDSANFAPLFKLRIDVRPNCLLSEHFHVADYVQSFPEEINVAFTTSNAKVILIFNTHFALERATQTLLLTLKNPILPSGLLRTNDSRMISFSSP